MGSGWSVGDVFLNDLYVMVATLRVGIRIIKSQLVALIDVRAIKTTLGT